MTPEHATLIRRSWPAIDRHRAAVAATFYQELFELAPHARDLFARVDLDAQGAKFMHTVEAMVRVLDDPYRLVAETIPSGRRHGGYGVGPRDYAAAGQALVAAIGAHLGDDFSPETRDAWRELYLLLSSVMQRAARGSTEVAVVAE